MKAKDIIAVLCGFLLISIAVGLYYSFKDEALLGSVVLGLAGLGAIGKGLKVDLD